jgi:uncharacterized protein (TIGR04222 family)
MIRSDHPQTRGFHGARLGIGLALVAMLSLLIIVGPPVHSAAAPDYGQPVPGQRVYDNAHALTAAEITDLERRAAAMTGAGAPTIVYLQRRSASYKETERDARDLMDAWDIESARDARDGVVIFVNLKPDASRHGQVALYAGASLVDSGRLPQRELQRIYEQEMHKPLAAERTAAGLSVGLDTLQRDLTVGPPPPPPPSRAQRVASTLAGWPLVLIAALALVGTLAQVTGAWRVRRRRAPEGVMTTTPPTTLEPAMVGALVTRSITSAQAEATILDLGQRGALTIEPEDHRRVHIRLHDDRTLQSTYERAIWDTLQAHADANGIASSREVARLPRQWQRANDALRAELEARGWYDPTATARRRPLYLTAALLAVFAALALVLVAVAHAGRSGVIVALLALGALVPFILATMIPTTTIAGDEVATPWRGYRDGLKRIRGHDLDRALPYAVALSMTRALDGELREASAQGFAPAWFARTGNNTSAQYAGFYGYWGAFHSTMSPSGAGAGGAGASVGGAGGGGGF